MWCHLRTVGTEGREVPKPGVVALQCRQRPRRADLLFVHYEEKLSLHVELDSLHATILQEYPQEKAHSPLQLIAQIIVCKGLLEYHSPLQNYLARCRVSRCSEAAVVAEKVPKAGIPNKQFPTTFCAVLL